jgi:type I restriction enzyme S subunit
MISKHEKWESASLLSLCQETFTIDPTKTPDKAFDYVDVSSVSNELWKIVGTTRHTGATAPSRARKIVKAGDVIFATVRPSLKRVAFIPANLDGQVVSTAFCVLRANPAKADPRFLYYSVLTGDFINQVGNLERGASYPAVTDNDVLGREILVPLLNEQRAIAAVLSKIQKAAEVQEKIVATLKELQVATMAKLFREGLRGEPLKQTEIGEIPRGWQVTPLGSLAQVSTGTTPSTTNADYYVGDIPFVKTAEIDNSIITESRNYISEPAVQDYNLRIYPAGSVFLAMYGQGKTRGRAALLGIPAATTQNTAAIEPSPELNGEFLWHYLLSQYEALRGIGNLGHLSHLNLGYVKELLIPVPPVQEQIQIKIVLSSLQHRAEMANQRYQTLANLFSAMLHLLMTGQVRVTEVISLKS